jgi:enediyne biosynthesis protein E4
MFHFPNFCTLRLTRFFIILFIVVFVYSYSIAQETEIFREIGWDHNVDPQLVTTDAGGLIDINNDGWIDIYPGHQFCLNNGMIDGIFQPFTLLEAPTVWGECRFADFDNDGFVDAYSTTQVYIDDFLFRNNGDSTFTRFNSDSLGIIYPATKFTLACAWADYNNDGWVDLLVGSNISSGTGSGIYLWQNENGTGFVDVADQMQVNVPSSWHGLVCADIDNDGDLDFFIAGGRKGDKLFRNDVTKFTDISDIAQITGIGVVGHSRSGSWGDYNNDGRLDLFVCDDEKMNRLYRNEGEGVWPEVAAELAVANFDPLGWGLDASATAVWGDYDNDADLDLLISSQGGEYDVQSENRLYRNDGAAGFVEIGNTIDLFPDRGQTHYNAAFGDIDNDGDLDIYVAVGPSLVEPALGGGMDLLFENLVGSNNNWLEFRLTGVTSNRSAIGARIRCVTDTLSQIREIQGGNGYNSISPLVQHFGFGLRTVVDSVIIRWPCGTIDFLFDVPVNQIIKLTEGSSSGVDSKFFMPKTMSLVGNYPNPFNPVTTIRFTLPKLEKVSLKVYDVLGRHVRTLVENRLLSGTQEIRWHGRDQFSNPVSSGTYLCRLIVGEKVQAHKMVLQK